MKKFFGGLFMAIGFIITLVSGMCSLWFFMSTFDNSMSSTIDLVLLFGGIPLLIGLTLFWVGRRMYRTRFDGKIDDQP